VQEVRLLDVLRNGSSLLPRVSWRKEAGTRYKHRKTVNEGVSKHERTDDQKKLFISSDRKWILEELNEGTNVTQGRLIADLERLASVSVISGFKENSENPDDASYKEWK